MHGIMKNDIAQDTIVYVDYFCKYISKIKIKNKFKTKKNLKQISANVCM